MTFRFSVAFYLSCILCILGALRHSQTQIIFQALLFSILFSLNLRLDFTQRAAGILSTLG